MNVVYVCSLDSGGPLSHLRSLAPSMARLGLNVRVLCANDAIAASFREHEIEATVVAMHHKFDALALARLWPLLRDADIVHTHDRRSGLFGRIVAKLRGGYVVHTLHGLPEEIAVRVGRPSGLASERLPYWRAAWLLGGYVRIEAALARLGMVVTVSQAMRHFLGELGLPLARVRVIGHSIDVRRDAPRVRTGTPVIGVAARLEHWKGIDVLLAACAQLTRPVRVEIFGDGWQRHDLEGQAAALGLDAHFHGTVENIRARLDALDAFVLPSRAENSPLAIVEAMAHALPVVATRVGGVPELVADEETGLLVEPDDPAALAGAITRIIGDPDFAAQLGCAGALRARREMCDEVVAPRMVQLYRDVMSGASRSAEPAHRPGEARVNRR